MYIPSALAFTATQIPRGDRPAPADAEVPERAVREPGPDPQAPRIEAMKARDREVRAHEAAHRAAGGPHVRGGARFHFQRGPNGVMYAIGGEVRIDTSPVRGDPVATLEKARQIQRAALAPHNPSTQDLAVAGRAMQMALRAQTELAADKADGRGAVDSYA